MARLAVKVTGTRELNARLAQMNPGVNARITRKALRQMLLLSLRTSATKHIYPGGKAAPKQGILTSRTGTLRRSLGASENIDETGLRNLKRPSIGGGTHLVYGKIHELGLGRYPKRPFLAPGLTESSRKFQGIFVDHWRREGGIR